MLLTLLKTPLLHVPGLVGALAYRFFDRLGWNYGPGFSGLILSDAFSLFFHLLLGHRVFGRARRRVLLETENLDSPNSSLVSATQAWRARLRARAPHCIHRSRNELHLKLHPCRTADALKSSESALKYFLSARLPRPFFSRHRARLRRNSTTALNQCQSRARKRLLKLASP